MKLTCIHLEGSKQGLTETLNGDVISVGRDPSNTLSFDPFKDLDVSTRHASILLLASSIDKNWWAFRHSSRSLPLNASINPFSVGFRWRIMSWRFWKC